MSKETYIDRVRSLVKQETGLKGEGLVDCYTLLVLALGENITLENIHDGWSVNMNSKKPTPPHCYGHDHLSIVPFKDLSKECQEKDRKYLDALKRVAKKLKETNNG